MDNLQDDDNLPARTDNSKSVVVSDQSLADYRKGYENGVYAIDKSSYEGYLSSNTRYDMSAQKLFDRRREMQELSDRLETARKQATEVFERLQMHLFNIQNKNAQIGRINEQISQADEETERYRQEKLSTRSSYSVIAALIFVAAGLIFMAGDLVISHEIVAYALNIRNNTEAWSFAAGLAALSILIKPAYDRIVEQPYHEKTPGALRRYAIFKGGLVVFALATLFVLGWFRYEAYRTDNQRSNLNRVMRSLQSENMDPQTIQKVESLLSQQQTLSEQLINSLWGLLSFVMTGILFAIAGAVCLGIGLPLLGMYWRRWFQIPSRMGKLRRRKRRQTERLEYAEGLLANEQTHKEICEFKLANLPNRQVLENRIDTLRQEINTLADEQGLSEMDRRISLYNDGYARGHAEKTEAQLAEETTYEDNTNGPTKNYEGAVYSGNGNGRENGNGNGAVPPALTKYPVVKNNLLKKRNTPTQPRPHQQLRKMISDTFYDESKRD